MIFGIIAGFLITIIGIALIIGGILLLTELIELPQNDHNEC